MLFDPRSHHRRSLRLKHFNYASVGAYFVTIVVNDRRCLLGDVEDDRVRLNPVGRTVTAAWDSLPVRFAGVELDAFVVRPNHVHGIIALTRNEAALPAVVGAF